jgi:hypothetical protein
MTNLATPGPNSEPILAGGRRMDAGRSRVSVRRTVQAQRLRDSSTTPRWLKSGYPQPAFICSTLPEDWARRISRALWLRPRRPHAVRPRTVRTIQINKQAPMNPAIR